MIDPEAIIRDPEGEIGALITRLPDHPGDLTIPEDFGQGSR